MSFLRKKAGVFSALALIITQPAHAQNKPPLSEPEAYEQKLAQTCTDLTKFVKEMQDLGVDIILGHTAFGHNSFGIDFAQRCNVNSGKLRPLNSGRAP